MSIRVKICGVTNFEDALAAVDAGADALGFMFYEPSSRYIDPHQAQALLDSIEEGERSHTVRADDVVSQHTPDIRRGRFIAPIADLSALGGCSNVLHKEAGHSWATQ